MFFVRFNVSALDFSLYGTAFVVALLSFVRVFLSVDLTDEVQHVGQIVMLLNGGAPLDSDLFIQQLAGQLFFPFFYIFDRLLDSPPWLLLNRLLAFVVSLLSALCIFRFARFRGVARPEATLLASIVLAFVPFSIVSLSYNNVAFYGFLAMCSLAALESEGAHSPWRVATIGMLAAICLFAYPTMLLAILVLSLLLLASARSSATRWRLALFGSFGFLAFAIPLLLLLVSVGWQAVIDSLGFSRSFGVGGGLGKLVILVRQAGSQILDPEIARELYQNAGLIWQQSPLFFLSLLVQVLRVEWYLVGLILFVLYLYRHSSQRLIFILKWPLFLAIIPVMFISFKYHYALAIIAIFYCLVALAKSRDRFSSKAVFVWPMLFYGVTVALTSGNGAYNAVFGLFGLMLYSVICLFSKPPSLSSEAQLQRASLSGCLVVLALSVLVLRYGYVYRDAPVFSLDTRIESGAFAGLYTTEERRQEIIDLQVEIDAVENPDKSVLFLDDLAHGYLMTGMKPASRMLFIHSTPFDGVRQQLVADYYYDGRLSPDVVFLLEDNSYPLKNWFIRHLGYQLQRTFSLGGGKRGRILIKAQV